MLQVFEGDTLLGTLDLVGPEWQEFAVNLPGAEPGELSLRAQPTVQRRKGGCIRHYGAIIERIAVTTQ